jgi:hypothetical protein
MGNAFSIGQAVGISAGISGVIIMGLGAAALYLLLRLRSLEAHLAQQNGEVERLRREGERQGEALLGLQAAAAEMHNHVAALAGAQLQQLQPPPDADDEIQVVDHQVDPHLAAVQAALEDIQNFVDNFFGLD